MSNEPIRILQCVDCHTIEPLPLHGDDPLEYLTDKHRFPDGSKHYGNLIPLVIAAADNSGERAATWDDWENKEFRDFVKRHFDEQCVRRPGQGAGLGTEFYDTKNTFQADALKCFSTHLRPKGRCPDYKEDRFRLLPNTKAERKEAGLGKTTAVRHLCDFCPVASYMTMKHNQSLKLDT